MMKTRETYVATLFALVVAGSMVLAAGCGGGSGSGNSGGGSGANKCLAPGDACTNADDCAGFICECNDGSKSPGPIKACAGKCSAASDVQGICDQVECNHGGGTKMVVDAPCP